MRWPNYNPVTLLKEAADKQKVNQNYAERALPPHPNWHNLPAYQCTAIWQGQVSLHIHLQPASIFWPPPLILSEGGSACQCLATTMQRLRSALC